MVDERVKESLRAIGSDSYDRCTDMLDKNVCYFCEKPVDQTAFSSEDARKEYEMSGMCQTCFDSFGEGLRDQFDKMMSTLGREQMEHLLAVMVDRRLKLEGKH